jgi:hypothetical protein
MSQSGTCAECGSADLIASGVFEHGTWIHRLTCWTCQDCQAVVAVPEAQISGEHPTVDPASSTSVLAK